MSAATINTKVTEAVTAIEAADWSTALTKLLAAKALLSAKPDQRFADGELVWDRKAIDALIGDVRRQQTAAQAGTLGIQKTNIKYVDATDTP